MTSTVANHYANHLAPIYSWMVGDFDAACKHADDFYSKIKLPNGNGLVAVDLGCGHGVHSIPLAGRGYSVLALDTSRHLLDELNAMAGELTIKTVAADLTQFGIHLGSNSASLIACMGDTLTHLPSFDAVEKLIGDSALKMTPDGLLTCSFRDYATKELVGTERFIPVRSDDRRIHTCFLDYRPDSVIVHDIVHSLVDSIWQTSISAYAKIRLHTDAFVTMAESNGLSLVHRTVDRGMHYFAFHRTQATNSG